MKDIIKILLIALPFALFAPFSQTYISQLGFGSWLVESLSIRGYWPVSIAFYVEDLLGALITVMPYVVLIYFFVSSNRSKMEPIAIAAYFIWTFVFNYQNESLSGSLYTLVQSANIAICVAILIGFILMGKLVRAEK